MVNPITGIEKFQENNLIAYSEEKHRTTFSPTFEYNGKKYAITISYNKKGALLLLVRKKARPMKALTIRLANWK
jgi:hypothetical protein